MASMSREPRHPAHALDPVRLRCLVLEQSRRAGVGHIGSALSVVDILAVLYGAHIRGAGTDDRDRDVFVLSKGHAALALYAALHLRKLLTRSQLDTYCGDGSLLGVHPEHQLRGVDFSTGSLGNGLSYAVGAAYGARIRGSQSRTYVLMSDAELNEGLVWEAMMFSAHHQLGNLVAILDANGQQALGRTSDVLDLGSMAAKAEAFGWDVIDVDGHDLDRLDEALGLAAKPSARPRLLIARTIAGKGVSFMEGRVEWHYLPMSDAQYRQAVAEVRG